MPINILPRIWCREREFVRGDSHNGAVAVVHGEDIEGELPEDMVDKTSYSRCAVQEGTGIFREGVEI